MKKVLLIFLLSTIISTNLKAQTVIVNPDGTHSSLIDNGSIKTIENLNGTHPIIKRKKN